MVRRTRAEMEQTRSNLLATARRLFAEQGYADTAMDELTAQAGLTRGALYHHFGDKKGLLAAVVAQIDAETDARLRQISDSAADPWQGFQQRCLAYLQMALEPEVQRIVLRDARAVLGAASPESQRACIASMQAVIERLQGLAIIAPVNAQALAALLYGSLAEAAFWIADHYDPVHHLDQATVALEHLLRGLKLP